MPYSKNYPKALTIWVAQEMFDRLTEVAIKSGVPKTRLIRDGIDGVVDRFLSGRWSRPLRKEKGEQWSKTKQQTTS